MQSIFLLPLFPHHFDDDSPGPHSAEFDEEDVLAGAKLEAVFGERHDDLVMQ